MKWQLFEFPNSQDQVYEQLPGPGYGHARRPNSWEEGNSAISKCEAKINVFWKFFLYSRQKTSLELQVHSKKKIPDFRAPNNATTFFLYLRNTGGGAAGGADVARSYHPPPIVVLLLWSSFWLADAGAILLALNNLSCKLAVLGRGFGGGGGCVWGGEEATAWSFHFCTQSSNMAEGQTEILS